MRDNGGVKRPLLLSSICLIAACQRTPHVSSKALIPTPFDSAGDIGEYERARRSVDGSPIPYERYAAAHAKARSMARRTRANTDSTPALLTNWTNLGPANVAGMSRSLVIDSTNPGTMYTTGVNGGVWKSQDAGATWTALGDFLPVLVIGSLALPPQDTGTIYAGTGDGFIGFDSVRGAGIFKSTDAGSTWTRLDSTAAGDRFTLVNKIVVSPNDINRVYAATNAGLLRSDDAGTSWTLILDRGFPHRGCHDLAIRTDQATDAMLASCGIPGARSNGALLNKVDPRENGTLPATIFLNPDAANNDSPWTPVLTDPNMGRTSLAIAPSNQNIVYASASASTGTFANALLGIFRSSDGGATWQATVRNTDPKSINTVLLGNPSSALCSGARDFTGQAWHDNTIAVDPTNPMSVWVAGVDVFRSDDGGANWALASYWWANPASPQYSHADHHVLLFHPNFDGAGNQTLFDVNDGGVFRTDNARGPTSTSVCSVAGSIRWHLSSTDLVTLQFYHGSIAPDGQTYFGGAQDNGTVLGTESGGPPHWTTLFGGDGGATAIDPGNPQTMYLSSTNSAILKSTDGGGSFRSASSGIADTGNFFLIGNFLMDPNNPAILWTGGNTIWRTSNNASSWTAASAPLVTRSFGAFAVAPGNSSLVLAGSRTGEIFRTTDALASNRNTVWPTTRPRIGWVSALVFDPVNTSTVYAVYSSFNRDSGDAHIYKSTDSGVTWTPTDGAAETALPDAPYFTLAVNPDNPSNLWVAGDLGLFISMDAGATWAPDTSGLPVVATNFLKLQRDAHGLALYAFTHGRGAWRARVASPGN